jgi:hypothetical protein
MGRVKRYIITIADDDRVPLNKLCQKLIAAGGACVVLRRRSGAAECVAEGNSSCLISCNYTSIPTIASDKRSRTDSSIEASLICEAPGIKPRFAPRSPPMQRPSPSAPNATHCRRSKNLSSRCRVLWLRGDLQRQRTGHLDTWSVFLDQETADIGHRHSC